MTRECLNIVYCRPFKDFGLLSSELSGMIKSVNPKIKLWDISELISQEIGGDLSAKKQVDSILSEAEILFGFPPPKGLIDRAPKLHWIQDILAGVEMFLSPDIVASPVILTNARGIHPQVVESALNMMLLLTKNTPTFLGYQKEKRWRKNIPGLLHSKTVGILGLGNIGSEIARVSKSLHMKTLALDIRKLLKPKYVDVLLSPEKLPELLSQSDLVVIALPLTRETTEMIGEKELKLMKPTTYLINISRGGVIDENALVRALKEHWIAGAGLDVFATEPLPDNSPLWEFPNVIITPHIAGLAYNYDVMATRLFCRNLKRYLSGRELLNVVDKIKGY